MQPLKFDKFSGLFPRIPATALPINGATIANSIDFAYGELRSLKGDFTLKSMGVVAKSVFSEDGMRFYAWSEDADWVISPLQSGVANDRLYYTTDTDFRVTTRSGATLQCNPPGSSFRVGVPQPTAAMFVTVVHPALPVAATVTVENDPPETYAARLLAANDAAKALVIANTVTTTETRAYTYCYANIYNEEGPPAPPVVVEVKSQTYDKVTTNSTVTVQVAFGALGEYVTINAARVYRTANGGAASDYYFVMSIAGTANTSIAASDTVKTNMLNEVLSSVNNYPPSPLLKGLFSIGNGILAAWKGSEMWFSDAYRPWSWPPANVVTFLHPIVSAIAHGAGALVTTVGKPSMVSGVSPDAMSQTPIELMQAGSSKWGILSFDGMAAYASNDGIVVVIGGQANLKISERFFTREVWRARTNGYLSTMQFAYYDGRLVVFSRTNAFFAFMISMDEAEGSMTDLPEFVAQTACVLVTTDQMYAVKGVYLNQFCGGSNLALKWTSGDIVLPSPTIFSIAQAECTGNFTIKFYQKGVLGYSIDLGTGDTTFRLPSQPIPGHAGLPLSDRWQIEIVGYGTFKKLALAQSGRGLSEV